MGYLIPWLLALVLIAGCRKEPAAARPAVEPPDAGVDPCVTKCVHDSQMKATSPENIERECRAECAPQ